MNPHYTKLDHIAQISISSRIQEIQTHRDFKKESKGFFKSVNSNFQHAIIYQSLNQFHTLNSNFTVVLGISIYLADTSNPHLFHVLSMIIIMIILKSNSYQSIPEVCISWLLHVCVQSVTFMSRYKLRQHDKPSVFPQYGMQAICDVAAIKLFKSQMLFIKR